MTRDEIKKALECCAKHEVYGCESCPAFNYDCSDVYYGAIDVITELEAQPVEQKSAEMTKKGDEL